MSRRGSQDGFERTRDAVERQLSAMNSGLYEVGLFRPANGDKEAEMLPRTWDQQTLLDSLSWLRWQNSQGRNIYVRPAGEHHLSLIDDLTPESVLRMKNEGFPPCVVVETSPGNLQAWLNHGEILPKDLSTAAARALAQQFGGDKGAADWRHFGRLSGLTNRKPRHQQATGLYPFVQLIEAQGIVYPKAQGFLATVRRELAREMEERARLSEQMRSAFGKSLSGLRLTIDDFRKNAKYNGDGNRIDLAYAIYALSHNIGEDDIRAAIASRDLAKKGSERRQQDYISRTLQKARSLSGVSGLQARDSGFSFRVPPGLER
jgi:RepB DNA-primase from phage plasmid